MPLQEFSKMLPDIRFLANIHNTHTPWIVCCPELLNTIFSGGFADDLTSQPPSECFSIQSSLSLSLPGCYTPVSQLSSIVLYENMCRGRIKEV